MMRKTFDGFGSMLRTPAGAVVAAEVVWHVVMWLMGVKINYAASVALLLLAVAAASFLSDRLIYFFAQFVLPIQNPKHRPEIYARVKNFENSGRGPAMFIKNGELIVSEGEMERRGPGLIVADTASAAMLRTKLQLTEAVGPGIRFTKASEYLEDWVDLRLQWQYFGYGVGGENTKAMTRDEIAIEAAFSARFQIRRPKQKIPTESGVTSQYGYDEEAARRAITNKMVEGEGEKKMLSSWERIPADIIIRLWSEYIGKFKLADLFSPFNERGESGLQIIERMINKRLTRGVVEGLDSEGSSTSEAKTSREFSELEKHGIEVAEVRIHNIHLQTADEEQLLAPWKPGWMKNIQQEEKFIKDTESWNATIAREESSKRLSKLIAKDFVADLSFNPFRALEVIIKPIKQFILDQSAAGNEKEMESRLRKINDIWKWLLDSDADFSRRGGQG